MEGIDLSKGVDKIRDHYWQIVRALQKENRFGRLTLDTWNIGLHEKDDITEELHALDYLIARDIGVSGDGVKKRPAKDVLQRTFWRHIAFLDSIYKEMGNMDSTLVEDQYQTCETYLHALERTDWYDTLPKQINPPVYE